MTPKLARYIHAMLCALQDALVLSVFLQPSHACLRGALLASATLQLLPVALGTRMGPQSREGRALCASRLVRLAYERRCVTASSITLAAVSMLEVMRRLWPTLHGCAGDSRLPGRPGGVQDHSGCLRGLERLSYRRRAAGGLRQYAPGN